MEKTTCGTTARLRTFGPQFSYRVSILCTNTGPLYDKLLIPKLHSIQSCNSLNRKYIIQDQQGTILLKKKYYQFHQFSIFKNEAQSVHNGEDICATNLFNKKKSSLQFHKT